MNKKIKSGITLRLLDNWLFKRLPGGDAIIALRISANTGTEIQNELLDIICKTYRKFDRVPINNLHIFLPVLSLSSIRCILRDIYDAVDIARVYTDSIAVKKITVHATKMYYIYKKNPVILAMEQEFNDIETKKMKSYLKIDGSAFVHFSLSSNINSYYKKGIIIGYDISTNYYNIPGIYIECRYINGVCKKIWLDQIHCHGDVRLIFE